MRGKGGIEMEKKAYTFQSKVIYVSLGRYIPFSGIIYTFGKEDKHL